MERIRHAIKNLVENGFTLSNISNARIACRSVPSDADYILFAYSIENILRDIDQSWLLSWTKVHAPIDELVMEVNNIFQPLFQELLDELELESPRSSVFFSRFSNILMTLKVVAPHNSTDYEKPQ